MAAKRPLKLYVHGNSYTCLDEIWYCIDLESLPEDSDKQYYPVFGAKTSRTRGAWTVMGDVIYYACKSDPDETYAPVVFAKHSLSKSTDPYSWDVVCDDLERRLTGCSILIPLDGNRILLLGVKKSVFFHEDDDEAYDDHFMAEVIDLNTRIWNDCTYNLQIFVADFYSFRKTPLTDEQGKVKQVVFYSFTKGMFIFYDVYEDKFRLENHPQFVLNSNDQLPSHHISDTHILSKVTMKTTAALMGSTLYWFTHKLCVYGYDFRLRTWFQSQPLEKEQLWEIPKRPLAYPFLVDAYNGNELMLIVRTPCSKLGIAFLSIAKQGKSLDVIVKSRHTLLVDPTFLPRDGLAMMPVATLKTPGPDADSVSSPNSANRRPKYESPKVVCRCSLRSPVIEMNRGTQLVDIPDENKGLSLHVEEMQSADRESESTKIIDKALALFEAAKTAEREALIKLGELTVEADKNSRKIARITEELNAAQAANSEIETELRRLKVHCDQRRKDAENNRKYVEITGSLDQDCEP